MDHQTTFSITAWGALVLGIYHAAEMTEKSINPELKSAWSHWLLNANPTKAVVGWPKALAAAFDAIFGRRHISWMCFRRSCAASLIAIFSLTLIGAALSPEDYVGYKRTLEQVVTGAPVSGLLGRYTDIVILTIPLLFAVTVNLIPDYVALLSTRWVIHLLSRKPTVLSTLGFLLFDLVLTGLIATLGVTLGLICILQTMSLALNSEIMSVSKLLTVMRGEYLKFLSETIQFDRPLITGGVSFYSTFVTSTWLWLYVLAGVLVKSAHSFGVGLSWLRHVLNFEEEPMISMGWIVIILVSVSYWGAALAIRIWE